MKENKFSYYYDHFLQPVQVLNKSGKIVYINNAFTTQWGYTLNELTEYSAFKDIELKKHGLIEKLNKVFQSARSIVIDNYSDSLLISKSITRPILKSTIFHACIDDDEYIVLIHEDQSEMFLAEEEIKKARDGHKEAERLKDTFLNVLSHELRTPLNIILGYSSIIKESFKDRMNSEERTYLENLHSGSERLFKSITQMLEFAHLEAGNYIINIESINLIPVISDCVETIKKSAEEKKINVKTVFKNDKIFVDADTQCVENAVQHLLMNALKFTNQGFIEIEVDVLNDKDLAVCRIKDTGIGISTEYMDHLFQPFSQEDTNIGRNYEGNGLGLALSKRYIEKLGGSLLIDSIKGVGTTVTFTLPISEQKELKGKAANKSDKFKKILMLDDSNESYDLLNAFLKDKYRIEIFDFRNFDLELLKKEDYISIVFDVSQTHWDRSMIICKDIKRYDKFKRPIIILSTEFIHEKIQRFYEAGADKFLVKPFTKSDLLKILEAEEKN